MNPLPLPSPFPLVNFFFINKFKKKCWMSCKTLWAWLPVMSLVSPNERFFSGMFWNLNPVIVRRWEDDDCKSCTERDYEKVKMGGRGLFKKLLLMKLINLGNNAHLSAWRWLLFFNPDCWILFCNVTLKKAFQWPMHWETNEESLKRNKPKVFLFFF